MNLILCGLIERSNKIMERHSASLLPGDKSLSEWKRHRFKTSEEGRVQGQG